MSRSVRAAFGLAVALFVASCSGSARIDGSVEGAYPADEIVVKQLDMNRYVVLDTIPLAKDGTFRCKLDIEKGQPEFIYLYRNDVKLASLVLQRGDRVSLQADTLGHWSVEGSEESAKLQQVETEFAEAVSSLKAISDRMQYASEAEKTDLRGEFTRTYIDYYRDCVRYILSNSKSLTSVTVLFSSFGDGLPVFAQDTDGIHFSNIADSLEQVFPDSKYVKALRQEAQKRLNRVELAAKLSSAEQVDYLDIELPDLQAQKVKLSDVHSKLTLVYFWSASDAAQKMFNLDVLAPVYKEFHSKGFDIYQVSLDTDKGLWAKVVKEQNLPWTNVCDSRGAASTYALSYNVSRLPAAYIIGAEGLKGASFSDEKSLRAIVSAAL